MMKKRMAFVKILAIFFGVLFTCVGVLAGIGALVAKNPPEPLRALRHEIYLSSFTDEEKEQMIVDEVEKMDTVRSAKVTKSGWRESQIRVIAKASHHDDETIGNIRTICQGMQLWPGNFKPHIVTCTVTTR